MSDKINDGGPAFQLTRESSFMKNYEGMTLRAYFAAAALPQAVLDYGEPSQNDSAGQRRDRGNPVLPYASKAIGSREEIIAMQAVRYADALIAELAKGGAK